MDRADRHRKGGRKLAIALAAAMGLASGCTEDGGASTPTPHASKRLTVTSQAFSNGGTVPRRFTCDGEDVSPPLNISGVPDGTAELVVLAEDPDAPNGAFVHWLMWGVDPHDTRLAAGAVPRGATQGHNSFKHRGYGGPCPPHGNQHHYVFSVFAAGRRLALSQDASADDVERALDGHTLAYGTLTGLYGR